MALNNPRILIADDHQNLVVMVRAVLDLLGRKARLLETRTGEDALDELRLRIPDVLITSYKLGTQLTGVMLALQAKRESAALPVLVVASEEDAELDAETLAESPFQYLRRPFNPELLIRALRIALDGPEAVPVAAAAVDMLGPVPDVDIDRLRQSSAKLMRDVNAMSVILADRNGKVLTYDGAAGYIDRDLLAAGLGPTFANTAKILPIVGEQPRVLKYYDGDKYDIFCLAVGLHHFVSLIFDGASGDRALGNVKRFGGIAVNEMLAVMGETAFKIHAPSPVAINNAASHKATGTHKAVGRKRSTQELAAAKATATPVAPAVAKQPTPAPAGTMPTFAPIANFDSSIFDALPDLDMSQADDLFDMAHLATMLSPISSDADSRISIGDAQAQGIIGQIDDN
jgi:DNA-binding NarL/FixJ family response regulator